MIRLASPVLSPRIVIFALVFAALLLPVGALAQARDVTSVYEKRDSWPATMIATRTAYLEAKQQSTKRVDRLLASAWKKIQADYPRESGWYAQRMGRKHLEYFEHRTSTQFESRLIQPNLTAGGATLRQQFQSLTQKKPTVTDARWLQFFVRTCAIRDAREAFSSVWIVELRRAFEVRLAELVSGGSASEIAPFENLQAAADKAAQQLAPWHTVDVSKLDDAVVQLEQHYGVHFQRSETFDSDVALVQTQLADAVDQIQSGTTAGETPASLGESVRQLERGLSLALAGMQAYLDANAACDLESEWQQQYDSLVADLAKQSHFQRVASETYRAESLILESDRDPLDVVLRRTAALLADLRRAGELESCAIWADRLVELQTASQAIDVGLEAAHRTLHTDACCLRRQIAFSNPLLNFQDILFIKRHRALFNHMCDQYYGSAATPGGGLYVLKDAFGVQPQVVDVLADSKVSSPSRLEGSKLSGGPSVIPTMSFDGQGNRRGTEGQGGTFLSPDLSYDGTRVLFAYVENTGDMMHRHHVDPSQGHWAPGRCYHIFSVNTDGTDLRQLTEGTWNDFDPCWLPNGRIAFVSERRGGYLRCGRVCPNYTLFDMASDGSDVQCISFHETNEWHPSVTNDGMLVWTRWDYVDRHGCTAHMPWLTTLDGRDPRPVHGNYAPRPIRPDMEVDCRSVPDSRKFIATAAPHHGQAYGSLVLIDPQVADDDGMGPVRRITPEVGFPETQGGGQVYGTPWPLSEDYYLCVYDSQMQPGAGRQGRGFLRGEYGIYLVDAFGNRELLYRDPNIASLSPIPVQARPAPPVPVELAHRGYGINPTTRSQEPQDVAEPVGTVAVINVYDSLLPWPDDTNIQALRVLQVFPMSVPSGRPPHDTGLRVASAGDSVVPVRHVLGTVPVESDGSAYFEVPANKELFFQALDEHGLAVQSMRSATHVREGERLVCAGCHNPRHESTPQFPGVPLALQRKPSQLEPDVDGARPFSYPRLVQPVLDKHCVQCHTENKNTAPNLAREPITRNWFASYNSLIKEYGFYDYKDGYRTTPGQFGAKASKLYQLLQAGHYDVKLSEAEMHRITLWLDCTSMFYGVYEKEGGQAQLRGEIAFPTLE